MLQALEEVAEDKRHCPSRDAARSLLEYLQAHTPATVFQMGLHEFLEDFLERVAQLDSALASEFFEATSGSRELQD